MRHPFACWGLLVLVLPVAPQPSSAADAPFVAPATDLDSPYMTSLGPQLPVFTPWGPLQSDEGQQNIMRKFYDAGLRWIYAWVPWTEIEPLPDQYQWPPLDAFIASAHDEGLYVMLQVEIGDWSLPQAWTGPTRWNPDHAGTNVPPVDFEPLRDLWVDLVERYRPGGTLATERGWDASYGVVAWEFENEPDSLPWWANWGKVPKDYAAYLATIVPAIHEIHPGAIIAAPSLAQQENSSIMRILDGAPSGTPWLDEVLTPGVSEWSSETYRAADEHPAGGPYVDAYSWHYDNVNVQDGSLTRRADAIRAVVDGHATQAIDPTKPGAQLWYAEGSPLFYEAEPEKFAWASAQLAIELLAAGVSRLVLDPGSQPNSADWPANPEFKCIRTITKYFPRAGNVVRADADVDADRVTTYKRNDLETGLITYAVWARDLPQGSQEEPGTPFTVRVPVRTATADVVDSDWSTSVRSAEDGGIEVTLHADDPSPVVFVAERSS